jgi:hypothetical protein
MWYNCESDRLFYIEILMIQVKHCESQSICNHVNAIDPSIIRRNDPFCIRPNIIVSSTDCRQSSVFLRLDTAKINQLLPLLLLSILLCPGDQNSIFGASLGLLWSFWLGRCEKSSISFPIRTRLSDSDRLEMNRFRSYFDCISGRYFPWTWIRSATKTPGFHSLQKCDLKRF